MSYWSLRFRPSFGGMKADRLSVSTRPARTLWRPLPSRGTLGFFSIVVCAGRPTMQPAVVSFAYGVRRGFRAEAIERRLALVIADVGPKKSRFRGRPLSGRRGRRRMPYARPSAKRAEACPDIRHAAMVG